jgi:acetamidase/formamidase
MQVKVCMYLQWYWPLYVTQESKTSRFHLPTAKIWKQFSFKPMAMQFPKQCKLNVDFFNNAHYAPRQQYLLKPLAPRCKISSVIKVINKNWRLLLELTLFIRGLCKKTHPFLLQEKHFLVRFRITLLLKR